MTYRECTTCHVEKPLEKFRLYTGKQAKSGLRRRQCTDCATEYEKDYKAKNREDPVYLELQTQKTIKRRFGLYGLVLHAKRLRGMPCEICGCLTKKMAIDHDHVTGNARGLLCYNCNTALGAVRESPEILDRMAQYLVDWSVQDYDYRNGSR